MTRHRFRLISVKGLDTSTTTRQELISGWNQELIEKTRVSVIGAGALGNEIIKNLVLLGVGHIKVVDFDVVDHSNLSRCVLFRRSDADRARLKVDAIVERAKELDPHGHVEIRGYALDIFDESVSEKHEVFRDTDVVFSALDNLMARIQTNIYAYYNEKPLIDGGIEAGAGYVTVVVPPYTSCLLCSVQDRDMKIIYKRFSCKGQPLDLATPKMPAVITTTSIIAGIMVHEFIKLVHGLESYRRTGRWNDRIGEPLAGKRLYVNLTHNIYVVTEVPVSRKCPLYQDGRHLYDNDPRKPIRGDGGGGG